LAVAGQVAQAGPQALGMEQVDLVDLPVDLDCGSTLIKAEPEVAEHLSQVQSCKVHPVAREDCSAEVMGVRQQTLADYKLLESALQEPIPQRELAEVQVEV